MLIDVAPKKPRCQRSLKGCIIEPYRKGIRRKPGLSGNKSGRRPISETKERTISVDDPDQRCGIPIAGCGGKLQN